MKTLKKIAILLDEFSLQTPSQQLLDRFLIGYPRDGEFHRLQNCQISACLMEGKSNPELARRVKDFGLVWEQDLVAAMQGADAALVALQGSGTAAREGFATAALESTRPGCCCFVHGILSSTLDSAKTLVKLASRRNVSLLAGTSLPVTWRLPQVDLPLGTRLKEALVVVQGASPVAELTGLEGILPIVQRRRSGESGVRRVRPLAGSDVWQAGKEGLWSWPLLASALSRSDSPQGDPVKDGRTQDLVGLGLVPKLATNPRAWLLEHYDGLRTSILVLDGVVADCNFAVQARDGSMISAQIYQPPAPGQHQFSRLAAVIEEFFLTGKAPWPIERNILTAGLLEAFRTITAKGGAALETPSLKISFGRRTG